MPCAAQAAQHTAAEALAAAVAAAQARLQQQAAAVAAGKAELASGSASIHALEQRLEAVLADARDVQERLSAERQQHASQVARVSSAVQHLLAPSRDHNMADGQDSNAAPQPPQLDTVSACSHGQTQPVQGSNNDSSFEQLCAQVQSVQAQRAATQQQLHAAEHARCDL